MSSVLLTLEIMEARGPEVLPCSPWHPATAPAVFLLDITTAQPSCLPDRHSEANPGFPVAVGSPSWPVKCYWLQTCLFWVPLWCFCSGLLTAAEQCCSESRWASKTPRATAGFLVPREHGRLNGCDAPMQLWLPHSVFCSSRRRFAGFEVTLLIKPIN